MHIRQAGAEGARAHRGRMIRGDVTMHEASYFQLLNPMVLALFAAGFAAIWVRDRAMVSALWFCGAYACGSVGFLLDFFVRDAVGTHWGQYVSNVWLMAMPLGVTAGHAVRYGERPRWFVLGAIYGATFAVVSAFLFVWPVMSARMLALNLGVAALLAVSLPTLWRARWHGMATVLFVITALSTVLFVARPLLLIAVDGLQPDRLDYANSLCALTLHLFSAICAIALAAALLFSMAWEMVRRLDRQLRTDPLTGALNRRALEEAFGTLDASTPASLVMLDIDRFKAINDTHGHVAGDTVIREIARLLADRAPSGAHIARIGGEEFVVLLPRCDRSGARLYAQDARAAVAALRLATTFNEHHTASFGVTERRRGETLDQTLRMADEALYRAKRAGRDRVCVAGEETSEAASPAPVPAAAAAASRAA